MFRKSGHHFFDRDMINVPRWRAFFPPGRLRPNGKRARPLIVGKWFGRSIVCVGIGTDR